MAEIILIKPEQITATTILGGNVDQDKYLWTIHNKQVSVLEPLLGSELYDKILSDYELDSLTGKYKTLYDDYIVPILINESLAEYIEVSNFIVENGGTFKHSGENRESTTKDDTQFLAGKFHNLASMYIGRFKKWICKNRLSEYKYTQDEVNAQDVEVKAGWYFGGGSRTVGGINECDL